MAKSVSHIQAIGFALTAFTVWVLSDVFMKMSGEASLPPLQVVGFLGITGVIFMLMKTGLSGNIKTLWPKNPRAQIGRAVLSFVVVALNAVALNHLTLSIFYITVFTAPMMIAILAACFLGEHMKRGKTIAIVAGFLGVLIAINPLQGGPKGDWIGYAAALASAAGFAVNMTWLRVMAQSETGNALAFFNALIQTVFGFGFSLGHGAPVSGKILVFLLLMGIFNVIGNLFEYRAIRGTTAANVAQFHYTQIITGALLGYLIWQDLPTAHLIIGAAIIITSGLYIAGHARKSENIAAVSPR